MTHSRTENRCRLFHRWSKWGPVEMGKRLYKGERVGDMPYQERTCERCGRVQIAECSV